MKKSKYKEKNANSKYQELDFDFDTDDNMMGEIGGIEDEQIEYTDEDETYQEYENYVEEYTEDEEYAEEYQEEEQIEGTDGDAGTEGEKEEKVKLALHILTDKSIPGLKTFFKEKGLSVYRVYTDVNELRDEILMSMDPARVAIIDTGTGKFSLVGARKNIIDLMGISDDEETRIIVFYTDSVIKSEAQFSEKLDDKEIEWVKYQSTSQVILTLLKKRNKEEYISVDDEEEEKYIDGLNFKGLTLGDEQSVESGNPIISIKGYIDNIANVEYNSELQKYPVYIKNYG